MVDPREEFRDMIRELAQEEIKNILKNEDIYQNIMGTIVEIGNNNTYSVDVVTTIVNNVINNSGTKLNIGDTVIVNEKYGSNYSNCYITAKTGSSLKNVEDTEEEIDKKINNVNSAVSDINTRIGTDVYLRISGSGLQYSPNNGKSWYTLSTK